MEFGPLKFAPVYQQKIWGGRSLERLFQRQLPPGRIGESWEISVHRSGLSIVAEPEELAGVTLEELCRKYPHRVIGDSKRVFPLLVKLIDAQDTLSVQVHPDDHYAKRHGASEAGKNEMWYVLAAEPGAKLIYGIKPGITRDKFLEAIESGCVAECLNEVAVQPGDCFYVPAGVVHALGAGILVLEIQQSSDAVYRIFDWNRVDDQGKPRPLHVHQALEVINFDLRFEKKNRNPTADKEVLVECPFFTVTKHRLRAGVGFTIDRTSFKIITSISHPLSIESRRYSLILEPGSSCLIPACCHEWQVVASSDSAEMLCSYV